jgi:ubiquinone biosynthesis protein
LEEELEAPPQEMFPCIEKTPIAAASLGQVHAASLPNGDEVVIKIQRPNIRARIDTDLNILRDVASYAQRHTPLGKVYNLEDIAEDFAHTLRSEMNYMREGRNADRFRDNFRTVPGIYIPRVYWEYTTQRVLVLERIEGIKISNIEAIEKAGFDRSKLAEHAADLSIKEVLEDGYFHADPHPGNIFVLENGALGVMDFGMVGHLSDQDRIDLIRISTVAVRRNAEGVVDELVHIGAAPPDVDRRALSRDIERLLNRYADLPLQAIRATEVLEDVRPILFEHRLHLPSNLWLLGKSLAMMEGIGRKLDPDFDIFAFSRPYVNRLLRQVVIPNRRQLENLLHRSMVWGDLLNEVPRTGLMLLDRLEKREPIPLSIDKQNIDRLDTLTTRLALSLIITGMTIGIALVIPTLGGTGTWLRAILIASFVVALGLGVGVMITIVRKK